MTTRFYFYFSVVDIVAKLVQLWDVVSLVVLKTIILCAEGTMTCDL